MRRLALVLALPLLAGCGVLTVNIDVYKGALANHVRVQTEQVAAMSMGAKPILAELRLRLEEAGCKTPASDRRHNATETCQDLPRLRQTAKAVPDERLADRDAKRVNAILSLYEDRKPGVTSELVAPLAQALRTLGVQVEKLQRHLQQLQLHKEAPADLAVIKSTEVAVEQAWRAAMLLLADSDSRARLVALGREADMLWNVAWIASQLTSAEGLRQLVQRPEAAGLNEVTRLRKDLPQLAGDNDLKKFDAAAPVLGYLTERLKCSKGDPIDVDQPKNSPKPPAKTCPDDGRALAQQLVRAHWLVAGSVNELGLKTMDLPLAYCLRYACQLSNGVLRINSGDADELTRNIGELKGALDALGQKIADAGLEQGRPDKGLESLIDKYLEARAVNPREFYGEESERERARLLDALINFAEKVLFIANNDALIRGSQQAGLQHEQTSVDRYIRVLQAVGNSLLSQVDELRHRSSHWSRIRRAAATERSGIRNAEAVLPQAVIDQVRQHLKPVLAAADMNTVEALLKNEDTAVGAVVSDLDSRKQTAKPKLDTARQTTEELRITVARVIGDGLGEKAIAALNKAGAAVPFADVSQAITTQLQTDENAQWAQAPGAPNPAAEALRTAGRTWTTLAADATFQVAGTASPRSILGKALDALRARSDAAVEAERKVQVTYDALARSLALVERFTRSGRPPLDIPTAESQTAKDITDVMLASLRYQHIEAVKDYGPDHPKAQNLAAAIELNHAYRSGMVYIRPASAFLRNSYPATVLQGDPVTGAWRNMLTDQALRQLPFYGTAVNDEASRTTAFIDKQFWQSVNQVRVAGAGDTNYVIAKDDVGNWYVKSYSADPKQIFQSARNLALFATGPAGGAAMLSRGTPRTRALPDPTALPGSDAAPPAVGSGPAPGPAEPARSETARSALTVQLDQFTQRYEAETRAAHRSLKVVARKLPQRLRDLATSDTTDDRQKTELQSKVFVDGTVPAEMKTATTDAKAEEEADKKKDLKTLRDEAITIAQAIARYRADLTRRLDDNKRADNTNPDPAAPSTTPPAKTIWKDVAERTDRLVRGETRSILERWVRDLETATENYQSVLLIVGNSAGVSVPQGR